MVKIYFLKNTVKKNIFGSIRRAVDIKPNFNGRYYSIVRYSCRIEYYYITLRAVSNGSK